MKSAPAHVEVLTSAELAALLRTTPGSLRNAVHRGHVPPGTRIHGIGIRWRRDEIDAWLARQFAERGA